MRNLSRISLISLLALALVGCSGRAEEIPTPAPETAFAQTVSVTGEMVPARWATLSMQTDGIVEEVLVQPGDEVAAGDLLTKLDPTDAQLAMQEAEAALARAQAELARLKAQPRPQDIVAAEQQVDADEAALSQAAAERDRLASGVIQSDVAKANAEVVAAEVGRKEAQVHYDETRAKAEDDEVEDWRVEEAALRLRAAEQSLEAAQIGLAYARGSAAARRKEAEAAVRSAEAQRDIAQAQLELTKAGALAEEIALAETDVAQARVELDAAQMQLERCELRAPFGGTVGEVDMRTGESIGPGQPVVTLGDLSTLRVETTDLDEIDVARVEVGQTVDVTFDALPDDVFTGHVIRINPMAEPGGGGVDYTVVIELEELAPEIRWGMTAFVDIEVGE